MKATIELREVEIYAYHGCFAEEQVVGNRFIVDMDLDVEVSRASHTDDVRNALNYVEVIETVREVMSIKRHLLETVVSSIIEALHVRYDSRGLAGGWVRVRKMAPPIGGSVESVGVKMKI